MKIAAKYRNHTTTIPLKRISECALTDGQSRRAQEFGATHVFITPDVKTLSQYVHDALDGHGIKYIKIGHTSYKSKTWGAIIK